MVTFDIQLGLDPRSPDGSSDAVKFHFLFMFLVLVTDDDFGSICNTG